MPEDHYITRMELAERDLFIAICDLTKRYNIDNKDVVTLMFNIGGDIMKLVNGKYALQKRMYSNG